MEDIEVDPLPHHTGHLEGKLDGGLQAIHALNDHLKERERL